MQNFSFSQVLVSQLWTTLGRKLMKRPTVFITYSQSAYQIMHVYQVLRFEFFFQKFYDRFNIKSFFLSFTTFARKLMKRPTNFMSYFQTSYHYVLADKILSSENIY